MAKAVSPLAPARVPDMPVISGVRLATASAGIKYVGRTDVLARKLAPPKPLHARAAQLQELTAAIDEKIANLHPRILLATGWMTRTIMDSCR